MCRKLQKQSKKPTTSYDGALTGYADLDRVMDEFRPRREAFRARLEMIEFFHREHQVIPDRDHKKVFWRDMLHGGRCWRKNPFLHGGSLLPEFRLLDSTAAGSPYSAY
jgi:hypothetical protein